VEHLHIHSSRIIRKHCSKHRYHAPMTENPQNRVEHIPQWSYNPYPRTPLNRSQNVSAWNVISIHVPPCKMTTFAFIIHNKSNMRHTRILTFLMRFYHIPNITYYINNHIPIKTNGSRDP